MTDPDLEGSPHATRVRKNLRRVPLACGGFAIAVGAVVLVGWWLGLPWLTSVVPGLPPSVANCALMAIVLGASLILSARGASRLGVLVAKVCAGAMATIAVVTLVEYVSGLDLRVDDVLLSTGETFIGRYPDRPSPQSAVAFLLASAALLILDPRRARPRRIAEVLALASALPPLLAILGYLFGVAALYEIPLLIPYTGMGIPSALALLALSAGIAAAGIDAGVLSIFLKQDSGGTAARHLAVWILVSAPVACAIAIGARLGLYAAPFASALVVLLTTVAGSAFVLRVSWGLSGLDAKRREADEIRARLASVVSSSGDIIVAETLDGRITDWNLGAERILGYRAEERVGRPSAELYVPDPPTDLDAIRDAVRRGQRPASFETAWRRKDGILVPVFVTLSPLFDSGCRVFGVSAIAQDITARKRLEEERAFLAEVGSILASSLELDATLASIGQLVTRALADVCIVYLVEQEHAARRIKVVLRDPSQDWIREQLMQNALDRRRASAIWSEIEAHRSVLLAHVPPGLIDSIAQDEEHARALRAMNMSSVMLVPLVAHGRLIGAMSLVASEPARAYTPAELRFAEQIAQRAAFAIENARLYDKARRAVQTRDEVLGIVAHDLRNPLGAILLQAELLRHGGAEAAPRSRRHADLIERSAKRMSRLIQDLLDVTRMEAGRLSVERTRVGAGALVTESMEAQRALAAASSLELRVEVARDLPEVWADRDRLQQVFENLLGNAVKFTEPGGTIAVGAAPREGEVLFWVADTGPGLSGEQRAHVFDRFWQARSSGRHGAGLGLPIARGIVEAHGGRIWVESTPGRGSTFLFTIPAAPLAEGRPAPSAA